MCLGQRILATGERVQEQCPKVAITPDSWMHTFGRIGQQHPEITLSEFARRAKMSLIDVLRNIFRKDENPDWVPKPGDFYCTGSGETLEVEWADVFGIHWTTKEFSRYSDIQGMYK